MAEILDVPIEAFWGFSRSSDSDHERLHECVELIHSFQQLQDFGARQRCLAFVKAEAEASNRSQAAHPASSET